MSPGLCGPHILAGLINKLEAPGFVLPAMLRCIGWSLLRSLWCGPSTIPRGLHLKLHWPLPNNSTACLCSRACPSASGNQPPPLMQLGPERSSNHAQTHTQSLARQSLPRPPTSRRAVRRDRTGALRSIDVLDAGPLKHTMTNAKSQTDPASEMPLG